MSVSEERMNHLGALGLLAGVSVHISGPEADELRESIEQCFGDAEALGMIRWRRVLNRFDVSPAPAPSAKEKRS